MQPVLIIQNVGIEAPGAISDYLNARRIPYQVTRSFDDNTLPELNEISAIINLGCPESMTRYREHDHLLRVFEFVTDAARENKPYLGVCFGGQMLAHVLGARVEANKVKEIGTYDVRLTNAGKVDPILDGFDSSFPVFHWHGDTFRIPDGAERLVQGDDCRNQAFRLGRMAAIQFHLEADSAQVPEWCDVYADELDEVGKDKQGIITDFQTREPDIRRYNDRLLDNFFALAGVRQLDGSG